MHLADGPAVAQGELRAAEGALRRGGKALLATERDRVLQYLAPGNLLWVYPAAWKFCRT